MALEVENLRDENSGWTGWLVRSPAQALVHLVWFRMIHTSLANGVGREGAGVKPPHLTNDVRPKRGQGEKSVGFYFPFRADLIKVEEVKLKLLSQCLNRLGGDWEVAKMGW